MPIAIGIESGLAGETASEIVGSYVVGCAARVDQWAWVSEGTVGKPVFGIRVEVVFDGRTADPVLCRVT